MGWELWAQLPVRILTCIALSLTSKAKVDRSVNVRVLLCLSPDHLDQDTKVQDAYLITSAILILKPGRYDVKQSRKYLENDVKNLFLDYGR